jgi:hypothetical protein
MPRIYSSCSDPIDFCKHCFPDEKTAEALYGNVAITGEGPDDRGNCFGYEADHPPYEDTDYDCELCRKPLKEKDN